MVWTYTDIILFVGYELRVVEEGLEFADHGLVLALAFTDHPKEVVDIHTLIHV
jgi:hypothetical protein